MVSRSSVVKGGIGREKLERPCAMIYVYPAQPITTVSLVANTYCMMDGLSSLHTLCHGAPGSSLVARVS